jgi:ketosteroid isomerase-like protein
MTSQQVHDFLERFQAAWLEGNLEAVSDCYVDDCELISPIFHTVRGRAALEKSYRDAFRAFGTVSIKSDEPIIDNEHERAAVVWTFKTKHQGEIFGVPRAER